MKKEIQDIYTEVGLEEFAAVDKKVAPNGDVLYVLIPKERPEACDECGSLAVYRHKKVERKVQDLDIFGHRVGLSIQGYSYRCQDCGNLIRSEYPSLGGRLTKRLSDAITEESFDETFAKVAKKYHVTATTVASLFNERADSLLVGYHPEMPQVLGIDEVHLDDNYRGVFTRLDKNSGGVIEFTEERTKKSIKK